MKRLRRRSRQCRWIRWRSLPQRGHLRSVKRGVVISRCRVRLTTNTMATHRRAKPIRSETVALRRKPAVRSKAPPARPPRPARVFWSPASTVRRICIRSTSKKIPRPSRMKIAISTRHSDHRLTRTCRTLDRRPLRLEVRLREEYLGTSTVLQLYGSLEQRDEQPDGILYVPGVHHFGRRVYVATGYGYAPCRNTVAC